MKLCQHKSHYMEHSNYFLSMFWWWRDKISTISLRYVDFVKGYNIVQFQGLMQFLDFSNNILSIDIIFIKIGQPDRVY